ncbi:hypothetical protein AYI68_g157 [Smittium mucronatum]|uniref:Uncharacterized protein n=1 Tax=Smittium mucronatum TaxID=133383 RepID=A0A1R0H981_9FUNG|nr:hypothetical protein AYI68_g157 [Smittium mucronatum]
MNAIKVAEKILHWDFTKPDIYSVVSAVLGNKKYTNNNKGSSSESSSEILDFKPVNFPPNWASLLMDPKVLQLFISVYNKKSSYRIHNKDDRFYGITVRIISISLALFFVNTFIWFSIRFNSEFTDEIDEESAGLIEISEINKQFIKTFLLEASVFDQNENSVLPLEYLFLYISNARDYLKSLHQAIEICLKGIYSILRHEDFSSVDDFDDSVILDAFYNFLESLVDIVDASNEWKDLFELNYTLENAPKKTDPTNFLNYISEISIPICHSYFDICMALSIKTPDSAANSGFENSQKEDSYAPQNHSFVGHFPLISKLILLNPYVTLSELCNLIESNLNSLRSSQGEIVGHFTNLSIEKNSSALPISTNNSHKLLSWIFKLCGYILADNAENENVLIPSQILESSIEVSKKIFRFKFPISKTNGHSSPRFMGKNAPVIIDIPMNFDINLTTKDPLINIILMSFSCLELILSDKHLYLTNPLKNLIESIFNFFARIGPVYFFPNESDYEYLSLSIRMALGKIESPSDSVDVISRYLYLTINSLLLFSKNEILVSSIVESILPLLKSNSIKKQMITSNQYRLFVGKLIQNLSVFPQSSRSKIVFIVSTLSVCSINNSELNFGEIPDIFQLADKFFFDDFGCLLGEKEDKAVFVLEIICSKALDNNGQKIIFADDDHRFEYLKNKVSYGLDIMDGIFMAAHPSIVWDFHFLITEKFVKLISYFFSMFSNYSDMTLKLLKSLEYIVKYQEFCWFTEVEPSNIQKYIPDAVFGDLSKIETFSQHAFATINAFSLMLNDSIRSYASAKMSSKKLKAPSDSAEYEDTIFFLQNSTLLSLISQISTRSFGIWPTYIELGSRSLGTHEEDVTKNFLTSLLINSVEISHATIKIEEMVVLNLLDPYLIMINEISSFSGRDFWFNLDDNSVEYILKVILHTIELPFPNILMNASSILNRLVFRSVATVYQRLYSENEFLGNTLLRKLLPVSADALEKLLLNLLKKSSEFIMERVSDEQKNRVPHIFNEFYQNLKQLNSIKILLDEDSDKPSSLIDELYLEIRQPLYSFLANLRSIIVIQ